MNVVFALVDGSQGLYSHQPGRWLGSGKQCVPVLRRASVGHKHERGPVAGLVERGEASLPGNMLPPASFPLATPLLGKGAVDP